MIQILIHGFMKANTNFNLFLNFNTISPTKWKSGLIFCLLDRVKQVRSFNFLFDNEVKLLKGNFFVTRHLIEATLDRNDIRSKRQLME